MAFNMSKCIYCLQEKSANEFSLEHIVPQFLGGAYAPDIFKTRNVCKKCNNNLGLFVDGSFARDSLIGWYLREIDSLNIDTLDKDSIALPLVCMGKVENIKFPDVPADYVCESWLGPFGEQIYWVRPDDTKKPSYIGGNPIDSRRKESTLYCFLTEKSKSYLSLVLKSFSDFESKNNNIRRVLGAEIFDSEGTKIEEIKGFDKRTQLDEDRVSYFYQRKDKVIQGSLCFDIHQSRRFLAKLAIGFINTFYDNPYEILENSYSKILYNLLWLQSNGTGLPKVNGGEDPDQRINEITAISNCITILFLNTGEGLTYTLNLGGKKVFTIKIADTNKGLSLEENKMLILNKNLEKSVFISFREFIDWKLKNVENKDLTELVNISKSSEKILNEMRESSPINFEEVF